MCHNGLVRTVKTSNNANLRGWWNLGNYGKMKKKLDYQWLMVVKKQLVKNLFRGENGSFEFFFNFRVGVSVAYFFLIPQQGKAALLDLIVELAAGRDQADGLHAPPGVAPGRGGRPALGRVGRGARGEGR